MKKIAKVITECTDCIWCNKIVSDEDKHTKAFICQYDELDDNGEILDSKEPFLLDFTRSAGTFKLPIPENCPLEDYKEPKK